MSERLFHLTLTPRDPLIARDGRPFSTGLRMRALPWLYPSVVAGALRTLIGQRLGGFAAGGKDLVRKMLSVVVAGPLPCLPFEGEKQLCFPAPLDVAVERRSDQVLQPFGIRPWDAALEGVGCDALAEIGLYPTLVCADAAEDFKPEAPPAWWAASKMVDWLLDRRGATLLEKDAPRWPPGYFLAPVMDRRVHAAVDSSSGAAKDGMLFTTTALDLTRLLPPNHREDGWLGAPEPHLVARVNAPSELTDAVESLDEWAPVGGERRQAHWRTTQSSDDLHLWVAPARVRAALRDIGPSPRYVRLMLATPALFDNGWLPKWLDRRPAGDGVVLVGRVPKTDVEVRLLGACVGRWQAISGWSHEHHKQKPVRRLVPAGSVYFFRVESGDAEQLADRWLQPVSDQVQDQVDGFGLALWGLWEPFDERHTFGVKPS